jgi:cytoskeleton protein RodZ
MAPQIGRALREARTRREIELGEVERATRIRVKFLRAMEEDRWEALPAPAYARGFLSAYAKFLGLDDEALVDQYRRTVEPAERAEPIPHQVLQPGVLRRRRSVKPVALLVTALAAAAVLGLVVVGILGGSDDGGEEADRRGGTAAASATRTQPTEQGSEVSLELRSTGSVWVCLVDDEGRAPVNGETLTANEVRGPFESRAFEMTLGNGSVEITVGGEPAEIPPVAEPLGYRITPSGVRELEPAARPTCL